MSTQPRACRVLVRGRVQGVAFRWSARERARELGVSGWVRNLRDGGVEAQLEASSEALEAMLAWLRRGPPGARVDGVDVREAPLEGAAGFAIR